MAFRPQLAYSGGSKLKQLVVIGLLFLLLLALLIQLAGIFRRSIHWDEFLFLTNVYRSIAGDSLPLLQTSYVYLFKWLPSVGGDEIDQIVVARTIYLVLWACSLGLLYRLGCRLLDDRLGALAGASLYALFSFCLLHSVSFRIDGLLLPCLLGAALLLCDPTRLRLAAAGVIIGIAFALSIKTVLWAPAFVGIFALGRARQSARLLLVAIIAGTAVLASIYLFRTEFFVGAVADRHVGISIDALRSLFYRMLFEEGLFPNRGVLFESFWSNGATWLMIGFGTILAAVDLSDAEKRRAALRLLLAASPIATILIYANAWQYAYVVLLPTTCLLAGRAISFLVNSKQPVRNLIAVLSIAGAAMPMAAIAWAYRFDGQQDQKQVVSIVHKIFPQPVPYIDKTGMVSSFIRQPFPLTGQVIKSYRDAGSAALTDFIDRLHPPLLIVDSLVLDVWQGGADRVPQRFRLLAEDEDTIRKTYAQFWGPIYLAGREWRKLDDGEIVGFEVPFEGTYTLLGETGATIDGHIYQPGESVTLSSGRHRLESLKKATDLRLLWGNGLEVPAKIPSSRPIFAWYGGA